MKIRKLSSSIINSSLTKHEKLALIFQIIVEYTKVKKNSYFILGSYAVREMRSINDLDINMDYDEFKKLKKLAEEEKIGIVETYNNQIRWFYDMTDEYKKIDNSAEDFSIEVFQKKPTEGYPNENFSLQVLKDNKGLDKDTFGHQFFSLKTLLDWKKTMNRSKDLADIALIEEQLNKEQKGGYYKKYIKYKNKYLINK